MIGAAGQGAEMKVNEREKEKTARITRRQFLFSALFGVVYNVRGAS